MSEIDSNTPARVSVLVHSNMPRSDCGNAGTMKHWTVMNVARVHFSAIRQLAVTLFAVCIGAIQAGAGPKQASRWPMPASIEISDFHPFDEARARLGRLLFYDKVLSGNRNISCGTCHNHTHAGTDGLSLGVGEGGIGLGPQRRIPTGRWGEPEDIGSIVVPLVQGQMHFANGAVIPVDGGLSIARL